MNRLRPPNLYTVSPDGEIELGLHPGQSRAYVSPARFTAVLAGTQSGKTTFGPWWLEQEIRSRGAGDYLAVTASYDLFKLKMLPALREVFETVLKCGRYWAGDRVIELADPNTGMFLARRATDPMWGRIILRSAEAPGGLESGTALAAWLDEAGQESFDVGAWRAVLRRLSLAMGRVLLSTTVYNLGWVKTEVYDRWKAGDADYNVVQFPSVDNPVFPRAEWDRARASMPVWEFDRQYRGLMERAAGLVYDCFKDDPYPRGHLVKRFAVPPQWPRSLGLDFGGTHTAGVFFARDPATGFDFAYREYRAGGRTAAQHAAALRAGEPMNLVCVGGSKSEGQWRDEFRAGGLHVYPPDVHEVDVGIARVYGAIKSGRVFWFDDLGETLRQLRAYSRKLDKTGEPTEQVADKASYHELDAVRYVLGWLYGHDALGGPVATATAEASGRWGAQD